MKSKPRMRAWIVAVLVVVATLGTVAVVTAGAAQAKVPCSVTVHAENVMDNAVQSAINTYPGGVICVGKGTFPEQLSISSPNTVLRGAGAAKTIIEPTSVTLNTYDDDLAVQLGSVGTAAIILVGVPCTSGTTLGNGGIACSTAYTQVTGVTVEDLTVNGAAAASSLTMCGDNPQGYVGVDFQDSSGTLTSATVENIATSYACNAETSVYATNGWFYTDTPTANTVTVSHTTDTSYMKNGITCDDVGESCSIVSNTVTGSGPNPNIAQNGIQVAFGAVATVSANQVSGNVCTWTGCGNDYYTTTQATGVLLYDPATGTTASGNTLKSNQIGILFEDDGISGDGYSGPVSLTISSNTIDSSTAYGIVANGAPGSGDSVTISSNTVNNEASLNPSVWGAPGILVDTGAFTLSGNHILGSSTAAGSSNGASQTVYDSTSIATGAIQGASESGSNPTNVYISSNSYTSDSYRLVTLGVNGGTVNVEEVD